MAQQHPHGTAVWSPTAMVAAATVTGGVALASLLSQHVSNAIPHYFYALAVLAPLSGLVIYPLGIVLVRSYCPHLQEQPTASAVAQQQQQSSSPTMALQSGRSTTTPSTSLATKFQTALPYSVGIGACFAVHNLLREFGLSGQSDGAPDVSTVLSLLLLKLVVPVSLAMESIEKRQWPTYEQLVGIAVLMTGVGLTILSQQQQRQGDHEANDDANVTASTSTPHSPLYGLKLLSLCLASVPLAMGYFIVKVARRNLPDISGAELWACLCLPELVFAVLLVYVAQKEGGVLQKTRNLLDGIACIWLGIQPPHSDSSSSCAEACRYFWYGLPFGLAFNLATPILIKLQGSTSVPLFKSLALPLATLLAMTQWDTVIQTDFSWTAVGGILICTLGLALFYCRPLHHSNMFQPQPPHHSGEEYTLLPVHDHTTVEATENSE